MVHGLAVQLKGRSSLFPRSLQVDNIVPIGGTCVQNITLMDVHSHASTVGHFLLSNWSDFATAGVGNTRMAAFISGCHVVMTMDIGIIPDGSFGMPPGVALLALRLRHIVVIIVIGGVHGKSLILEIQQLHSLTLQSVSQESNLPLDCYGSCCADSASVAWDHR